MEVKDGKPNFSFMPLREDGKVVAEGKVFTKLRRGGERETRIFILLLVFLGCLVTWSLPKASVAHEHGDKNTTVDTILRAVPLTGIIPDGHNDFPIWLRAFHGNRIYGFNESSVIDGQVDFPRLRQGQLHGQFWSVYVPCPKEEDDFDSSVYYKIVHDTLQQIDLMNRLIDYFPQHLSHAYTANDVWSSFKRNPQIISSLMGAEGLHQIGNSASIMRLYYRLGVRYITLTHDCNNMYADAAQAVKPVHNGLSTKGKEIVREMNRIGMLVDLSHTSDATMIDALNTTLAPVIFSHSNARALCPHPRNVPDAILFKLRDNGGVVMVTFYAEYTKCDNPRLASLQDVADHIDYIGRLIGFRHIGIGSDFDGMASGPNGLEDVGAYPSLIAELVKRGISRDDIEGIIGGNILRVIAEAERVAQVLSLVLPIEDEVKPLFP